MPSSGRGLKSGEGTGYAHVGASSALHVGVAAEKTDASKSARIRMNVFMFFSPPPKKIVTCRGPTPGMSLCQRRVRHFSTVTGSVLLSHDRTLSPTVRHFKYRYNFRER